MSVVKEKNEQSPRETKKLNYQECPCNVCQTKEVVEVPYCREYTNDQPVHICKNCGFVYAKFRRTAKEIADSWSDDMYHKEEEFSDTHYTARIPAVKARQTYMADTIDTQIGLKGKYLADIGAGEGQFLEIVSEQYQGKVFGIEPSVKNCQIMDKSGFKNFEGSIEDYAASAQCKTNEFDIVTAMWTLAACFSATDMIQAAYKMLKPGGHLVIAEGSRILVPFKKPLNYYFSKEPQDLHPFHPSANALKNLFKICGFEITFINRYIDTDYLLVVGKKISGTTDASIEKDNYQEVSAFFERWHHETKMYYK